MSDAQLQIYKKGVNRLSAVHLAILSNLTQTPVADFFSGIPQIEDLPVPGVTEETQKPLVANNSWLGLTLVMAQYVANQFNETSSRQFAAAVEVLLSRKLNA